PFWRVATYPAQLDLRSFPTRRSSDLIREDGWAIANADDRAWDALGAKGARLLRFGIHHDANVTARELEIDGRGARFRLETPVGPDRKSTRLNSSHVKISYAVFCLKKK